MAGRQTILSGPFLAGAIGAVAGLSLSLTTSISTLSEGAQFLFWLFGIILAFIGGPMVAVVVSGSGSKRRVSIQAVSGLLLGVIIATVGLLVIPEGTLRPGWGPPILFITIALLSPGLFVAVMICEIGANRRSEVPTAIGHAFSAPVLRPFATFIASGALLILVPTVAFVLSDSLHGRVGEPFVTGSLILSFGLLPWAVYWLRPRGSFEGNAILMVWGAAVAVSIAWIAWFASESIGELEVEMWFQPLRIAAVPDAFTLWLAPGLLLSLAILARLHQGPTAGENPDLTSDA